MKHLRQLLASILRRLGSQVENPINQQPSAENERESPTLETSGTPPIARAIFDIPTTVIDEYRAAQKQQHRDNEKAFWVTLAAVAGAFLYAAIAAFLLYEMRTANELNARPYVHVSPDEKNSRIFLYNFGKSPVRTYESGTLAYSPRRLASGPSALHPLDSELLFPGSRDERGTENYGQWVPLGSLQPTPKEQSAMESGTGFIYIKAEVVYSHYLTRVCTEYAVQPRAQLTDGIPCSDADSNCADQTCK